MYMIFLAPIARIVYLLRDTANQRWYGEWGYIAWDKATLIARLESTATGREILPVPVEVDVTSLQENRIEDFHVILILDHENQISYAKAMYPDPLQNIRLIDSLLASSEIGCLKVFKVQI